MIRYARTAGYRLDSLSERFACTQQDLAKPARLRRLKTLQQSGQYPRKLLILWGLWVLASSLTLISSNFGDLTTSF